MPKAGKSKTQADNACFVASGYEVLKMVMFCDGMIRQVRGYADRVAAVKGMCRR